MFVKKLIRCINADKRKIKMDKAIIILELSFKSWFSELVFCPIQFQQLLVRIKSIAIV
jgi:hypothetical protein